MLALAATALLLGASPTQNLVAPQPQPQDCRQATYLTCTVVDSVDIGDSGGLAVATAKTDGLEGLLLRPGTAKSKVVEAVGLGYANKLQGAWAGWTVLSRKGSYVHAVLHMVGLNSMALDLSTGRMAIAQVRTGVDSLPGTLGRVSYYQCTPGVHPAQKASGP